MPNRLRLFAPLSRGERETDARGSGDFEAARGDRYHKGRDYLASPGELVRSPVRGIVRRIGQCYGDTRKYKLVEINAGPALVRVLYVDPEVFKDDYVAIGDRLGYAQDIAARYPGMKNHVHVEVQLTSGVLLGKGRQPDAKVWVDPHYFMW